MSLEFTQMLEVRPNDPRRKSEERTIIGTRCGQCTSPRFRRGTVFKSTLPPATRPLHTSPIRMPVAPLASTTSSSAVAAPSSPSFSLRLLTQVYTNRCLSLQPNAEPQIIHGFVQETTLTPPRTYNSTEAAPLMTVNRSDPPRCLGQPTPTLPHQRLLFHDPTLPMHRTPDISGLRRDPRFPRPVDCDARVKSCSLGRTSTFRA